MLREIHEKEIEVMLEIEDVKIMLNHITRNKNATMLEWGSGGSTLLLSKYVKKFINDKK